MRKILAVNLNAAVDKVYAVDDFAVGGVFRPRDMTATAGGKGLNVARVVRMLGEPVTATGFLGGDNGRFIAEQVREAWIDAEFMQIEGESRVCIAVTDPINHTSTEVLEAGPEITPLEYGRFLEHYRRLLKECSVVTASGSLPRGVPADFYRKLIGLAGAENAPFILDTSGNPLAEGIQGLPYMVKPNLEEAGQLLNRDLASPADQMEAVLQLKQMGIALPCITLGKDGCVAGLPDGVYRFRGPAVEVVNTVGSGDSFVAGCAVGFSRHMPPIEAVKLGMAAGMANTQFLKTGMISRELVDRFLPQIRWERVN